MEYIIGVVISGALTYYLLRQTWYKGQRKWLKWLQGGGLWVLCGLSYQLTLIKFGYGIMALVYFGITGLAILFAIIDLMSHEVPSDLLLVSVAFGLLSLFVNPNALWYSHLAGFVVGIGLMWVMSKITRGAIGDGDIYLLAVIALCLGWQQAFIVFLLALVLSGLVGIVLLIGKVVNKKTVMPFIPFIAVVNIVLLLV